MKFKFKLAWILIYSEFGKFLESNRQQDRSCNDLEVKWFDANLHMSEVLKVK